MSKAVESVREWRKRQRDEGKRSLTLWLEGETLDRLHAQAQAFGVTVPELITRLSERLLQGNTRLEGLHEQRVALKAEMARLEARVQALVNRYPSSKVADLQKGKNGEKTTPFLYNCSLVRASANSKALHSGFWREVEVSFELSVKPQCTCFVEGVGVLSLTPEKLKSSVLIKRD